MMGNKAVGLYKKFIVERIDGRSEPGKKHAGCEYFVLDLTHDKFAAAALFTYADHCETEFPLLARDLRKKALALQAAATEARLWEDSHD